MVDFHDFEDDCRNIKGGNIVTRVELVIVEARETSGVEEGGIFAVLSPKL